MNTIRTSNSIPPTTILLVTGIRTSTEIDALEDQKNGSRMICDELCTVAHHSKLEPSSYVSKLANLFKLFLYHHFNSPLQESIYKPGFIHRPLKAAKHLFRPKDQTFPIHPMTSHRSVHRSQSPPFCCRCCCYCCSHRERERKKLPRLYSPACACIWDQHKQTSRHPRHLKKRKNVSIVLIIHTSSFHPTSLFFFLSCFDARD